MDPITLSLLLLAGAVVLFVGELLLPTHGVLGIAGLLCLAAAIGVTFYINRWLGLAVFLAAVAASPFVWAVGIRIWERSPVGRRMILQPTDTSRQVIPVKLGQVGTCVSDLRPMGECDFDELRLSVMSERGIIRAGEKVKVVAVVNGMPTVRPMSNAAVTEKAT
jgi:membrane-bound serine protease (ClpP class)